MNATQRNPDRARKTRRRTGAAPQPQAVLRQLTQLRDDIVDFEQQFGRLFGAMPVGTAASARNLVRYLGLRRHDLRSLQDSLAELGLSSLGRAEAHVLASVELVLMALRGRAGMGRDGARARLVADYRHGEDLLARHADELLGPAPAGRGVRIMVTMPSAAADDHALVRGLLEGGMDCMRINCAHDDAAAWERMIGHLRRACTSTGRSCRVLMDLAGPKLRTGCVEDAPAVLKVRPVRDDFGRVLRGARIWLTAAEAPATAPSATDAELMVAGEFLGALQTGDELALRDARDAPRHLKIVDTTAAGAWATAGSTIYLLPGIEILLRSGSGERRTNVGALPARQGHIPLALGDELRLRASAEPGRPAVRDDRGELLTPAFIGCTMPEILADVRAGEPIWFDDGRIGGVVERAAADELQIRITNAPPGGAKLRADKGINLPESGLRIPALTAKDTEDVAFVAAHADLVALSFANCADDVRALHAALARCGGRRPSIVLKIETQRGFQNLPAMLLTALGEGLCGVMIARGDLAVECGFERLAEVQEEILWLCEAAHVPVIWATQVLETLAKTGLPSRAEITDAAMGNRAECVMLNKGPHVVEAVQALSNILGRMRSHQRKKRSMLRALGLAQVDPAQMV